MKHQFMWSTRAWNKREIYDLLMLFVPDSDTYRNYMEKFEILKQNDLVSYDLEAGVHNLNVRHELTKKQFQFIPYDTFRGPIQRLSAACNGLGQLLVQSRSRMKYIDLDGNERIGQRLYGDTRVADEILSLAVHLNLVEYNEEEDNLYLTELGQLVLTQMGEDWWTCTLLSHPIVRYVMKVIKDRSGCNNDGYALLSEIIDRIGFYDNIYYNPETYFGCLCSEMTMPNMSETIIDKYLMNLLMALQKEDIIDLGICSRIESRASFVTDAKGYKLTEKGANLYNNITGNDPDQFSLEEMNQKSIVRFEFNTDIVVRGANPDSLESLSPTSPSIKYSHPEALASRVLDNNRLPIIFIPMLSVSVYILDNSYDSNGERNRRRIILSLLANEAVKQQNGITINEMCGFFQYVTISKETVLLDLLGMTRLGIPLLYKINTNDTWKRLDTEVIKDSDLYKCRFYSPIQLVGDVNCDISDICDLEPEKKQFMQRLHGKYRYLSLIDYKNALKGYAIYPKQEEYVAFNDLFADMLYTSGNKNVCVSFQVDLDEIKTTPFPIMPMIAVYKDTDNCLQIIDVSALCVSGINRNRDTRIIPYGHPLRDSDDSDIIFVDEPEVSLHAATTDYITKCFSSKQTESTSETENKNDETYQYVSKQIEYMKAYLLARPDAKVLYTVLYSGTDSAVQQTVIRQAYTDMIEQTPELKSIELVFQDWYDFIDDTLLQEEKETKRK